MRVQTFMSKVGIDTLHEMDDHINKWLEEHNVEPKFVTQSCGNEPHRDVQGEEPVVVTSIWY
jgi:hypothetical protein